MKRPVQWWFKHEQIELYWLYRTKYLGTSKMLNGFSLTDLLYFIGNNYFKSINII